MFNTGEIYDIGNEEAVGLWRSLEPRVHTGPIRSARTSTFAKKRRLSGERHGRQRSHPGKRARWQKTKTHAPRERGGFFRLRPGPRVLPPQRTQSAQSLTSSRIIAITIDRSSTREPILSFVKIFLRCVLTVAALMYSSFANACVLFPMANSTTI